jgi:hypothetical protein
MKDWLGSPAHWTLLSGFIKPISPQRIPQNIPWECTLGEPFTQAVEQFQKDGALVACGLIQVLAVGLSRLPTKELRRLLGERGILKDLPSNAMKNELDLRHLLTADFSLVDKLPEKDLLECSDWAKKAVDQFLLTKKIPDASSIPIQAYGQPAEREEEWEASVQDAFKKMAKWLIVEAILTEVIGNADYDWLKTVLAENELPPYPQVSPITPVLQTTSPSPNPAKPKPKTPPTPEPPSQSTPRPAMRNPGYIEPELVHIPAGYFLMGSNKARDSQAYDDELPQHQLYLPEYWIGRYTVTNEEYRLFLLDHAGYGTPEEWIGRFFPYGKAKHPVEDVSWNDARNYCEWLSRLSGKTYHLPSEA